MKELKMDRKLATIRQISDVKPIPNADKIECVIVGGWEVVVKKDEFKPGGWCVFFEIDSFINPSPEFEFLRKSCLRKMNGDEGFRLKTIKLRGQVSQGLVIKIDDDLEQFLNHTYNDGEDVTDYFKVKKWEVPIPACLSGQVKGNFPSFIPKTDQERIQNLEKYWDKYKDDEYEMTLKMDGSSMTMFYNNMTFGVCSRNLELKEDDNNSFCNIGKKYKERVINFCNDKNRNLSFQGELCGPGIQKNPHKLKEISLFIFDIFDIDNQTYLDYEERFNIINEIELPYVAFIYPIFKTFGSDFNEDLNIIKISYDYNESCIKLLDLANLIEDLDNNKCEGIVFKSITNPSKSFKVISNKYLLKEKD